MLVAGVTRGGVGRERRPRRARSPARSPTGTVIRSPASACRRPPPRRGRARTDQRRRPVRRAPRRPVPTRCSSWTVPRSRDSPRSGGTDARVEDATLGRGRRASIVTGIDAQLDLGAPGSISGHVVNVNGVAVTAGCVVLYLPNQYASSRPSRPTARTRLPARRRARTRSPSSGVPPTRVIRRRS